MKDVVLDPGLWESVDVDTEALLDQWLVAEGEPVRAGQPIARAMLVKTFIDVPAPVAGTLGTVLVPAGETFARGAVLARIAEA